MKSAASLGKASPPFLPSGSAPISAGGAFTPRATARAWSAEKMAKARRCRTSWCASASPTACCIPSTARHRRCYRALRARLADLTVRQNVQLHWVTIEALPELLDTLWSCGLDHDGRLRRRTRATSPAARWQASTATRSSTLRRLALEAQPLFVGNAEFYNLPRKFKISHHRLPRRGAAYPEINDVGLTAISAALAGARRDRLLAARRRRLSADPHLGRASRTRSCSGSGRSRRARALPNSSATADVLRENRERARLKFLFLRHGWTAGRLSSENSSSASVSDSIPLCREAASRTMFIATTSAFIRRNNLA